MARKRELAHGAVPVIVLLCALHTESYFMRVFNHAVRVGRIYLRFPKASEKARCA